KEIHKDHDVKKLTARPKPSKAPKVIGWSIPILIIGMILYTFMTNPTVGMQQLLSWLLWNGGLSALGTIVAFGHPAAMLTALIAAPFTSLNPLLAAGWFAGFAQAYFNRPMVRDFESLNEVVFHVKGFWRNKVTRVLLVVIFANIGSALGTFIAGADIVRLFIQNL